MRAGNSRRTARPGIAGADTFALRTAYTPAGIFEPAGATGLWLDTTRYV